MSDHQDPSTDVVATEGVDARVEDVLSRRHGMFGTVGSGDTSGYGGLVTTVYEPPAAARPYGGYFDEVVDVLDELLGGADATSSAIVKVDTQHDELTLHVAPQHLLEVARHLRDDQDLRFELCVSVSGVHYPEATGRELRVNYQFLSITHNRRVRIECALPDDGSTIPSLTKLYPAVDWHERETYDMFGIVFDGHASLTRILMPDDWPGHPQRKDYPLGGIPVEYKGAHTPPPDTRRSYR